MNMSYCRYRNTLSDLRDCLEDMREREENKRLTEEQQLTPLSDEEKKGRAELIKVCKEIIEEFGEEKDEEEEEVSVECDLKCIPCQKGNHCDCDTTECRCHYYE